MKINQAGFTLVEMAIVLVIVGLLLGGLLMPLATQMEQKRISETKKAMDEANEALLGFVVRTGYLPCPAISATNGLEDRTGSSCTGGKRQGFLPWATLSVAKLDGWNHLFRYSATPAFTDSATLFTLSTPRDITINTRDTAGTLSNQSAANDIPSVIMSHGINGLLGTTEAGVLIVNTSATNLDEVTNASAAGTSFVTRIINKNTAATGGEFDDLVAWLSPNILYNRMVSAQKLP
ncbi:MAG: prepilin-type N-terminal cleavage/methylation domain-containing protein [Deltaproteobacteria bacterium RIFOXYD12_FULL_55_16]|nr:MAG: prepilin-type N-terminal cleavage/methylation domain-containing protein [Deltaproteobacteria bacterium RIFOXYD12_FULL_55_16]